MNWKHRVALLAATAVLGCTRAPAQSEPYQVNHVHTTASIFMDTDEVHRVTLQIMPDSLRISTTYSFKAQDGSRTLHCSLPSSVVLERIVGVEAKARRTFLAGGGSVYQLKIDALDEESKKQTYIFVSSTAIHKSKQAGGYWQEGADGGQVIRRVGKALTDAIQVHKTALKAQKFESQPGNAEGATPGSLGALDPGLGTRPQVIAQSGHTSSVDALVITRDGLLASAGHDFTIRLWDLKTHRQIRVLGRHLREVNTLALSPDDHWLVSGGNDRVLKLWELPTGRFVRDLLGHEESVKAAVFTPDGQWVVSGSGDPPNFENRKPDFSIRIWDPRTGREVRRLPGHEKTVMSLDVSHDGKLLASASLDGTVKIWDLRTGHLERTIGDFNGMVEAASFTPDATEVVTVCEHHVELWEVSSGRKLATIATDARPYKVVFNPKKAEIAYPSEGTVKLFDLGERKPVAELKSAEKMVESMAFSPDGKSLLSGSVGGVITEWDTDSWKQKSKLGGFAPRLHSVAVSPDGLWIASGGQESLTTVWNTQSGRMEHKLKSENDEVHALAFSPDGRWLAAAGQKYSATPESPVEVWDFIGEKKVFRFVCSTRKVEALVFSPGGRWLAASTAEGTMQLWDLSGQRQPVILSPASKAVAFASDDAWIATGSRDNALSYWQLPNGSLQQRMPGVAWAYAMSPNGRWLASTGFLNEFKVWDIEAVSEWSKRHGNDRGVLFAWDSAIGRRQRTFRGHKEFVSDLTFSPDGQIIASCSWDGEIKLWSVETGRELRTLSGHSSGVQSIRFTPSGRHLLSAGWDGTLRLWDVDSGVESAALIAAGDSNDWLSIAPDGLFDGTADAMQQVGWRIGNGNETLSLDAFFTDFYRPGLLAQIVSGQHPKAKIDIATALRVPGLRTLLTERLAHLENHEGRLMVCFEQVPGVVMNIPVDEPIAMSSRNGYEPGSTPTCKFQKVLSANATTSTALMQQLQNWKPDVITTPWDHTSSGTAGSTLHVLTVGVSQYSEHSGFGRLPYAASSARSLERFFRDQQVSRALTYPRIRVWGGLYDQEATRKNVRQRLSDMAAEVGPDDVIVLYLAGHGVVSLNQEMFYFVPTDGQDNDLPDTGLSTAILAEALRNLPARRVMLIVDACQSGGAVEALSKIAIVKAQAEQVRPQHNGGIQTGGVGVHLIAATLPLSYAVGLPAGESALAQTILTGLQERTGVMTAEELSAYVGAHLPTVSEQFIEGFRQVPLTNSIGLDFPLAGAGGANSNIKTAVSRNQPSISKAIAQTSRPTKGDLSVGLSSGSMGYISIHSDAPDTAIQIPNVGEFYGNWNDNPCPPGTYVITASRRGMKTERRTVVVKPGQHMDVNFSLSPGVEDGPTELADVSSDSHALEASPEPLPMDSTPSAMTPQVLASSYLTSHDFSAFKTAANQALKEGGTVTIEVMHEHEGITGASVHPAELTLTRRMLSYRPADSSCRYSPFSVPLEKLETIEVTNRSVKGKFIGIVVRHLAPGTFLLHLDLRSSGSSGQKIELFLATTDSGIVSGKVNTLSSPAGSMQVLEAVANVIQDAKREITWK